eukprot:226859-Chlamydomonas_euryale.AAC.3
MAWHLNTSRMSIAVCLVDCVAVMHRVLIASLSCTACRLRRCHAPRVDCVAVMHLVDCVAVMHL